MKTKFIVVFKQDINNNDNTNLQINNLGTYVNKKIDYTKKIRRIDKERSFMSMKRIQYTGNLS